MGEIMDKLDKKLYDIQVDYADKTVLKYQDWEKQGTWESIGQIKQAFIDAGWLSPERVKLAQVDYFCRESQPFVRRLGDMTKDIVDGKVMTGQVWYERFWEEYDLPEGRNPKLIDSTLIRRDIDVIAKKASGIS